MKSTLFNMVAVLFGITLIASAGVGVVNMITTEPIAAAEKAATEGALKQVLPPFDATTVQEMTIDEMPIKVYTATQGGTVAGYAVESMTKNGFSGVIRMMVGFDPEGKVLNVNVLAQTETPGLGTKMADAVNPLLGSIQGKRLEEMKLVDGKLAVRKDGGDVDALTAATISSRAYVDAINRAWMAYKSAATGTEPTDLASGASKQTAANAENTAPEVGKEGCACGKEQKCDGCTGDCGGANCKKAGEDNSACAAKKCDGCTGDCGGANCKKADQDNSACAAKKCDGCTGDCKNSGGKCCKQGGEGCGKKCHKQGAEAQEGGQQ